MKVTAISRQVFVNSKKVCASIPPCTIGTGVTVYLEIMPATKLIAATAIAI
jgi:hypothetical protein